MLGTRLGSQMILLGPKLGSGADDEGGSNPMAGVTQDATSGIYTPATAAEWDIVLAAAGIPPGGPSLLWLCQEANGNLTDSIGSFTGTWAGTAPSYQQAVSGWSRKAIMTTNAATTQFLNNDASLPNLSTTSLMFMSYSMLTLSGGSRLVHRLGSVTTQEMRLFSTPIIQSTSGANTSNGVSDPSGAVRPYVTKFNRTDTTCGSYSDQEKVVPTFSTAVTGRGIQFMGDSSLRAPTAAHLYAAAFFGPAAEMTDAQIKSLLQTLGWAIPWS